MFAEARKEMEKDISQGLYHGYVPMSGAMFMDDAQRMSLMQQQIE